MYATITPRHQPHTAPKLDETSMRSESARLRTYKDWRNVHVSPVELARAGFYALNANTDANTDANDNVQCAFCNIQINQWQADDNVMSEHFRWSKHCPLLLGLRCGNVPLNTRSSTNTTHHHQTPMSAHAQGQDTCGGTVQVRPNSHPEDGDEPNINLTKLGVQMSETPAYPTFATREKRENSFSEWPRSMRQTPKQLAEAGFFYNGKGDQTICFHCGGGLKDWEDADDPWEQHAKWFPRCGFLRLHKSAEYIAEVCNSGNEGEETGEGEGEGETVAISTATSLNIKPVKGRGVESKEEQQPAPDVTSETKEVDAESASNRTLCKICFTNDVGVVFLPCGHIVACVDCAPALSTCAVCRKPLQATVRAFLS